MRSPKRTAGWIGASVLEVGPAAGARSPTAQHSGQSAQNPQSGLIGVDEIQYARGHKYLTLVRQIEQECTRLLWIGRERTMSSFEQFFALIGEELAGQIEFVCSDMWQPYLTVIRERCGQAIHILDRFQYCRQDEHRAGPGTRWRGASAGP